MKYVATVGDRQFTIEIKDDHHLEVDGEPFTADFQQLAKTTLYSLILDGLSYDINIDGNEELYHVMLKGHAYEVLVADERAQKMAGLKSGLGEPVGEVLIKAPMPGVVVGVPVEEGQAVDKNEVVVILESMKMQNEFKSPKKGVVSSVRVQPGDKVDQNAIMVTIS